MAPRKKVVVKKTKKVVEETLKVVDIDEAGNRRDVVYEEDREETVQVAVETSPTTKAVRVPVEDKQGGVESVEVVHSRSKDEARGKEKQKGKSILVEERSGSAKGKEKEREEREIVEKEPSKEGELEKQQSGERGKENDDAITEMETQTPEQEQEDLEDTNDARQPETPKKVEVKKQKKETRGLQKNKRRRKKRNAVPSTGDIGMGGMGGYKTYVYRVLKQVHPRMGVSSRAMDVLDMMMADMFERLADEAARLSKYTGKLTISSREVHDAVRLVLPGELGKHAISEGTKAISTYMAAKWN